MTAPTLRQVQQQFQDFLLRAPDDDGAPPAGTLGLAIVGQHGLAIYHNGYRARLREALAEAYGKTWHYLGDALFAQLCADFVEGHASSFRNLRWYGHAFPGFLARALDDHPVVAELAAFEWALGLAFDAENASARCMDDVRAFTPEQWETIVFTLHPSVQLLRLHGNAVAIWQALDKEQAPPDAVTGGGSGHWLVWRKALQPHFRSLGAHEAGALHGLQQGRSFAAVCAQALAEAGDEDISAHMAAWLQAWLADGILL